MRRLEQGWTLKDLSERTGIDLSRLSDFELGKKRPSTASLNRIAQAYE